MAARKIRIHHQFVGRTSYFSCLPAIISIHIWKYFNYIVPLNRLDEKKLFERFLFKLKRELLLGSSEEMVQENLHC